MLRSRGSAGFAAAAQQQHLTPHRCLARQQQQRQGRGRRSLTITAFQRQPAVTTPAQDQQASTAAPVQQQARTRGSLKRYQTKTGKSVFSATRPVKFHVRYKCEFGQEVFLVGSCAALGDWDVLRGKQLVWSPGHIWEGSVELPAGMHIQYKYVVRNKDGSVVRWQEGANVSLELPGGSAKEMALDVEDSWNKDKQVKRILATGTPVRFNIRVKAEFGQLVAVVGSCAALGCWALDQAVRLSWQEGHIWEAGVDMPAGELVQYKYVILNADGSAAAWQDGDNVAMEVPVAQGNTGRRRGVLVLDTWARTAAAGAGDSASSGGNGAQAASGRRQRQRPAGSWRSTPYASVPAGAGDVSGDASAAAAAAHHYSMMGPQDAARAIRDPAPLSSHVDPSVVQHWTDGPRFGAASAAAAAAAAGQQHHNEHHDPWRQVDAQQQAHKQQGQAQPRVFVPPPPAGSGTEEYARWQALQSVMAALQHSSELDNWVGDPTDPRMLAADRRLAALCLTV